MKSRILLAVVCSLVLTVAACSGSSGSSGDTEPTTATTASSVQQTISNRLQDELGMNAGDADCAAEVLNETLPSDVLDSLNEGAELNLEGEAGEEAAAAVREAVAQCQ